VGTENPDATQRRVQRGAVLHLERHTSLRRALHVIGQEHLPALVSRQGQPPSVDPAKMPLLYGLIGHGVPLHKSRPVASSRSITKPGRRCSPAPTAVPAHPPWTCRAMWPQRGEHASLYNPSIPAAGLYQASWSLVCTLPDSLISDSKRLAAANCTQVQGLQGYNCTQVQAVKRYWYKITIFF